jgi:hypothetical protein
LLDELARRRDLAVADVRMAIDAAADEPAPQDLYDQQLVRVLEKEPWMLLANLGARDSNGQTT